MLLGLICKGSLVSLCGIEYDHIALGLYRLGLQRHASGRR